MLATFLRDAARQPWAVGTNDCALFIADWIRLRTGTDPAASLRGRYSTPEEALALHGRRGLVGTVDSCVRAVGLRRTRVPNPGDVAVIAVAGELYCAIVTPRGYAVRADHAVASLPVSAAVRLVGAWRFPRG